MTDLASLKQSILGNDKAKLKLAGQPELLQMVSSCLESDDPQAVGDAAVVLEAFARLAKDSAVVLPDDAPQLLVDAAYRNPQMLAPCLEALLEVVSAGGSSLKVTPQLIKVIRGVLRDRSADSATVRHACDIVRQTCPSDQLVCLYRPLMRRIAYVTAPIFRRILSANNTRDNLEDFAYSEAADHLSAQPLPPHVADSVSADLVPLLLLLAHLLPEITQYDAKMPKPLEYTLLSFLRCANGSLRLASAITLAEYTRHHVHDLRIREATYKRLLPALVGLCDQLASSAKEQSALQTLAAVCQDYSGAATSLVGVNFADRAASAVADSYSPHLEHLSSQQVARTSDALLVLSGLCAVEDGHRDLVARYDLSPLLRNTLKRHTRICTVLAEKQRNNQQLLSRDLRSLQLSGRLTRAACYLIRALSRSASMLRTFLVDMDPVDLLMDLLSSPEVHTGDTQLDQDELVLRSVVLGITANLVVEFSAVRQRFLHYDLVHLLDKFIENNGEHSAARVLLRTAALQVIRNSLYSDDSLFKSGFMQGAPLNRIFELCEDPNDKVQQQCFNILRNVSLSSVAHAAKLYDAYLTSETRQKTKDADLLQFLKRHLDTAQSPDTQIAINYILVHFASSTLQSKLLLTQNEPLLRKLLEILKEPVPRDASPEISEKIWHVKLSIVWIVTNLTWREETAASDTESGSEDEMDVDSDFSKARNRARKLIDMGFYEVIKDLNGKCEIADFKERARTAIFQLVFHDGSSYERGD